MSNKKLIESINNIIKSILIEDNVRNNYNTNPKYTQLQRKYVYGNSLKDKKIQPRIFNEIFLSDPTINKTYDELQSYILTQNGVQTKYINDKDEFERYIRSTFKIGNDKPLITNQNGDINQESYKSMQDQLIKDINANNVNEIQNTLNYSDLRTIIKTIDQYSKKIIKDKINENVLNTIPIEPKDFPIYAEYMLECYIKDDITDTNRLKNVFYELFSLVVNENKIDNLNLSLGYAKNDNFDTLVQDINKIKLTKSIDYDLTNTSNSIIKQNGVSNYLANQLKDIDPTNLNKLLYFDSIIKWYYELQKDKKYKYDSDKIKTEIKKEVDDFNKQVVELDISDRDILSILNSTKNFNVFKKYTKKLMVLQKIKNPKYDKEDNNVDDEKEYKLNSIFSLFDASQWRTLYFYTRFMLRNVLKIMKNSVDPKENKNINENDINTNNMNEDEDEKTREYESQFPNVPPDMNYVSQMITIYRGKIFQLKPDDNYFGFLLNLDPYSYSHGDNETNENSKSQSSLYGISQLITRYEDRIYNVNKNMNKKYEDQPSKLNAKNKTKNKNNIDHQYLVALMYQNLNRNNYRALYNIDKYKILAVLLPNDIFTKLINDRKIDQLTIKEFLQIYGNNKNVQRSIRDVYSNIMDLNTDENKAVHEYNTKNQINMIRKYLDVTSKSAVPTINTDWVEALTGDAPDKNAY